MNLRFTDTYSFPKALMVICIGYLLCCFLVCLPLIFFQASTCWGHIFITEMKHHIVEVYIKNVKAQTIKIMSLKNIPFRGAQTAAVECSATEALRTTTKQTCFSQEVSTLKPGVHPWKNSMCCSYLPLQKACPKAILKAGDF